ncbi:hypothetical protein PV403_08725 [Paenibacillus sp. GYB006]|uniref:hypothetical protein n=1 Tax=Paenibacillus sp. GYB006 TaxID=2994394 RepID=UPI002F963382
MSITRTNGLVWKDRDGNPIHAHGGHILYYDSFYYWYGEDRRDDYYISCYRSEDLFHWEFRNQIITTSTNEEKNSITFIR